MTDGRLITLVDEGLGNSSYVVDLGDRRALVLDASRDPAPYLAAAERRGLSIAFAAETHLHADFVSGSRELAASGARVLAARAAGLEFPHRGLGHGEEVDLGGLTFRALATPGHTPEHVAYLLLDGRRPLALFSGGSLLVDAVARTDLVDPAQSEELARALWRSLHAEILTLPDDLAVYPTHGPGSFCSAPAGGERSTTIGRERAANPLLAAQDEDDFVRRLFAGLGSFPAYFLRLREVNRRGPAVYGPAPRLLAEQPVEPFRRLLSEGAQLIDARPIEAFASGHIPGALSIHLRAAFATWLGWLADPARPLAFVLEPGQDRADLVRQCLKVGYERFAGELAGGMAAWEAAGLPLERFEVLHAEWLHAAQPLLDVRQDGEFESGHVPWAQHVELGSLPRYAGEVQGERLAVMCAHGQRAMTGASVLAAAGHRDLSVVIGGVEDWEHVSGGRMATGPDEDAPGRRGASHEPDAAGGPGPSRRRAA
jgi:hydroxyacylglutathione hydrolase